MRKCFFSFVWDQISQNKFSHTHRSIDDGGSNIEKDIIPRFGVLVDNMQHQKRH